jgi:hypothetical protein
MMSKITCVLLDGQQAVRLIDRLLDRSQQPKLNDLQSTIVLETCAGSTYRSIADRLSYDLDYIKQIAARLWKLLSQLLGENICKSNIMSVLERHQESMQFSNWDDLSAGSDLDLQTIETWMINDRMTTMAVFCSGDDRQTPESLKLDLQVQSDLESLIWQNLHKPVTPNILMNEILSILTVKNTGTNTVNCLIVNCYFDSLSETLRERQDRYN